MPLNPPLQYFSPASEEKAGGEDLHNLHLIRRDDDGDEDGDDGGNEDDDDDDDGDADDQDGDDDDDADYVEKRMQGFASPSASAWADEAKSKRDRIGRKSL